MLCETNGSAAGEAFKMREREVDDKKKIVKGDGWASSKTKLENCDEKTIVETLPSRMRNKGKLILDKSQNIWDREKAL